MMDLFMQQGAVISPCGKYRYGLSRKWGEGKPCLFIMLNPSTADAWDDDPTIRRCIGFAESWGCEQLIVVNLFAFRATRQADMMAADDPVGPDNMEHVKKAAEFVASGDRYGLPPAGPVVCAWGLNGAYMGQDETVLGWLEAEGVTPLALALAKDGRPRHPLYLGGDLIPRPFYDLANEGGP